MTAFISSANNLQGGVLGESGPVTADGAFGRFSRYIVTLDAVSNAIFFDGVMRKHTTRTVESLPSIYLFARHSPTGAEAFASGRLYGCQIHKGGALVRDFVPCRRISDGKLGLYDQESNEFYGNDGSGDFASSISEDDFDRYFFRVKGISSDGEAYVNTVISPNGRRPQIDLTWRYLDVDEESQGYVVGFWDDLQLIGTAIGYMVNPLRGRYRVGDLGCYGDAPDTAVHTIVLNGADGTVLDGDTLLSSDIRNVADKGAGHFYVFARRAIDKEIFPQYFVRAVVYALKIRMDGTVVRDFVPCVRRSDGDVGFFDRVEGCFFGNSGTGRLRAVVDESTLSILPSLETTGKQYVDTDVRPDRTTVVSLDWQSLKASGESFQVLAGTKDKNNNQMTALIGSANNLQGGVLGVSSTVTADGAFGRFSRHVVTLDAASNAILFDGEKIKSTTPTVESLPSIYLFARHSPTAGAENFARGRFYGCQIHQGGALVRNYVPAKRKADGVIGLYDRMTGVFTPSTGDSDFVAALSKSEVVQLKYAESTGTQWVDTGVVPQGGVPVVKMRYAMTDTTDNKYVFGYYDGNKSSGTTIGLYNRQIRYRVFANENAYLYGTADKQVHDIEMNAQGGTRIDGEVRETGLAGIADPEQTLSYMLFARGYSGTPKVQPSCARIYSFALSMDGFPVLELVPVKRRSDGCVGLWDRLTGNFYEPEGGSLLAGPPMAGLVIFLGAGRLL